MQAIRIASLLAGMCASTTAQWLNYPTPGIPRTSDGKPNFAAPAPRTPDGKPDISGLWRISAISGNLSEDLKVGDMRTWAEVLYKQRVSEFNRNSTELHCLPEGPRISLDGFGPQKIIQTPSLVVILYEPMLIYRQVFMDGRKLPEDPNPTWMGYSVGHWDGDTLVVESEGFNDRTSLDTAGHPHSESLHITERFRRSDFGHMRLEMILNDPMTYTKPLTLAADMVFAADTEILEYVCENEHDFKHMVGKREIIALPKETIAAYTGVYQEAPGRDFIITLEGEQLSFQRPGLASRVLLNPETETRFSEGGNQIEFVKDAKGVVTHLIIRNQRTEAVAVRMQNGPTNKDK